MAVKSPFEVKIVLWHGIEGKKKKAPDFWSTSWLKIKPFSPI